MAARVVHHYLIAGTMTRVPDGWCDTCLVSSVWTGPLWLLTPQGVAPAGQVTGCTDCQCWVTRPN